MTRVVPADYDPAEAVIGEQVDQMAGDAIGLAYRALERFPEFVRRHRFVAGGAAISTALVALAGVAIMRRIRAGQTSEEAVALVTVEELDAASPSHRVEIPAAPRTPEDVSRTERIVFAPMAVSDLTTDDAAEAQPLSAGDAG